MHGNIVIKLIVLCNEYTPIKINTITMQLRYLNKDHESFYWKVTEKHELALFPWKNASLTKIHIKKTIKNDRGTVPGLSTSCLPGGLEFSSQHSVRQLTTTCSSSSLAPRPLPSSSSCTDQLQVTLAFCHNGLLYGGHSIGMVLHLNKWSQCDRLRVSSFT